MKLLKGISLFASALFLLSSCGGGGVASNEFVKQLPDDQKAAYIKQVNGDCACFSKIQGSPAETEKAAKALEAKVDEFIAAVDGGDYAKAKAANDAMDEAQKAVRDAEKAFQEKNTGVRDCLKKAKEAMSEEEQKASREAQKKISELANAKFGEGEDAMKKALAMQTAMCPASKKMMGASETMMRIYKKRGDATEKYMKLEMEASMPTPTTDSTATPEG
ncbi:MAG: hypothetical protein MK212_05205 [Saprospiraceae bacterium]|nr:hypothetical protein [Saprospiraceae bacterium]